MRTFHTLLSLIAILLTGCRSDRAETGPEEILQALSEKSRFVSVDQVAEGLINKDPSLLLVDVRAAAAFDSFALPGAINVPLAQLLDETQRQRMDCDKYEIIFYGSGTVEAEQAWMVSRRTGCEHSFIMTGGLNEWMEKILRPAEPPQTASAGEWEQYRFRQAARKYFAGASEALKPEPYVQPVAAAPASQKTIRVKPKKAEVKEEEGC